MGHQGIRQRLDGIPPFQERLPVADCDKVIAVRHEEAKATLQILGAEAYWLDYEDYELSCNADVVLRVARVIRQYRPGIVVTHAQEA